jgi:hypothetical protein
MSVAALRRNHVVKADFEFGQRSRVIINEGVRYIWELHESTE